MHEMIAASHGIDLDMAFGSFDDLEASVRASVERLRAHPWLETGRIHGLVFDVATGRLHLLT